MGGSAWSPPDYPPVGCCHWLTGDVRDGTATWCGATVTNSPSSLLQRRYCREHAAMAIRPDEKETDE
ncbi:hypothetical protein HW532_15795 [Kaustia mangrovi]|uniref:Uncharacterized protein n=1 Tax=Kaustia mangrovi TaxID=2593653 RepID=A0A7S8HCX0_9HYPH|nr:hypothetical protein [Kaustia mangrovi]QPC44025.1 hypothetical protein HW532_15795 [Kaustia mangrovi]